MRKITRSKSKLRASEPVEPAGRGERFGRDMNLRTVFDEKRENPQALEKAPRDFS